MLNLYNKIFVSKLFVHKTAQFYIGLIGFYTSCQAMQTVRKSLSVSSEKPPLPLNSSDLGQAI